MLVRWVGVTVFTVLGVAQSAAAQESPDEIARRDLIGQAEQASDGGDHTRALDLATRAGRLRMSPSLRLLIAQEHNALGHTLDALDFASRCVRDAESDTALNNRARILEACNALVESLRTRVGRVTVVVPDPQPAGMHVRVQGGELNPVFWGLPYPVLPGSIVVEAVAQDGSSFRREVTVAAGGSETVRVALERPAGGAVSTSVAVATGTAAGTSTAPVGTTPVTPTPRGPGLGPWIVGGAGVALLATGFLAVGLRGGAISERDAACDANGCDPSAQDAHDRAQTFSTLANVGFGLGLAAVAGGALWYVLGRPRTETPARTALQWGVSPVAGGAVFGLGGSL